MENTYLLIQLIVSAMFFMLAITLDLSTNKIPNWLSIVAIFSGFTINSYFAQLNGLGVSFLGFTLAFVILLPTFIFRILGAGDIKLMMGIGALMGPTLLLWSIVYAVIAGAITSFILIIWRTGLKGVSKTLKRYWDCLYLQTYFKPENDEAAGHRVPYAPALALGWIWACSLSPEISKLYSSLSNHLIS